MSQIVIINKFRFMKNYLYIFYTLSSLGKR
jgi:hypothetical protein